MKNHSGFITTPIIIAIVAILAVGGGIAYVATRPTQDTLSDSQVLETEQVQMNAQVQNTNNQVPKTQPVASSAQQPAGAAGGQSCTSTTAPWIKIISPNGGQNYNIGTQLNILWNSCNYTGPVFLELYSVNNGSNSGTTIPLVDSIDGTPNDGNETITLSTQIQPTILSGRYELRISGGGLFDKSDSTFFIFN
jgi:hypothetical protein